MKISELFSLFAEDKSLAKSHIKNLLEMAYADGHLDDKENELLIRIAQERRVKNKFLVQLKENEEIIEDKFPDEEAEKFRLFYDLVRMILADNYIHQEEVNLCYSFGLKFGYNKKKIHDLIHSVSENIREGHNCEETRKRVEMMLK